jgi:alpha-glucoside transport system permease protein
MSSTAAQVATPVRGKERAGRRSPPGGAKKWVALGFLIPALVFLGAVVIYPTLDTIVQSFQNDNRSAFVGLENYQEIVSRDETITAIKNNVIWVLSAPALITGLGLMFAILTERIRYATAIKIIVFLPMAISFTATGVIWRLMYETDPQRGFINASIKATSDVAGQGAGAYPTAEPLSNAALETAGGAVATKDTFQAGDVALIGLVGLTEADLPDDATQAAEPDAAGGLGVVVWRDFKPGGGEPGVVEEGELGMPGATVQLLDSSGGIVATEETGPDGTASFTDLPGDGPFKAQVAASTFDPGFTGISWLAETLVTPAIIAAFCWMWAGFAVVVIGAGLSALPRDVLEAARVDGANEWQTFRHVTLPLLAPVLGVVFVTLVINVLKLFDIIFVMAPGGVQADANVIALDMYKTSFTAYRYGLGSAIAVLLFVLVIPVMWLNVKRFRRES